MKAAIFGGSFDPPHTGHEEIIKKALKKLDIDVLFVVPTYLNPFKSTFFTPAHLRYKWVKKLLLPYPKAKIVDYEMRRQRPVSTFETIQYLEKKYNLDNIYLIIGADNIQSLSKWHQYDKLKKRVEFIIATRNDIDIPENLQKLEVHANISSTDLRKAIRREDLPKSIADEILTYYKETNEQEN